MYSVLKLHGQVKNERLTFQPNVELLYTRWLKESEGKFVNVTLKRTGPMKTHKQLGAYFGLAVMMIRDAMIDQGWSVCGVAPNKDMIHEILLKACGGVGTMGESLRLSEMTIEQAARFFDNCRHWAATQLHMNIPDPDPAWRQQYEMADKNRNSESGP